MSFQKDCSSRICRKNSSIPCYSKNELIQIAQKRGISNPRGKGKIELCMELGLGRNMIYSFNKKEAQTDHYLIIFHRHFYPTSDIPVMKSCIYYLSHLYLYLTYYILDYTMERIYRETKTKRYINIEICDLETSIVELFNDIAITPLDSSILTSVNKNSQTTLTDIFYMMNYNRRLKKDISGYLFSFIAHTFDLLRNFQVEDRITTKSVNDMLDHICKREIKDYLIEVNSKSPKWITTDTENKILAVVRENGCIDENMEIDIWQATVKFLSPGNEIIRTFKTYTILDLIDIDKDNYVRFFIPGCPYYFVKPLYSFNDSDLMSDIRNCGRIYISKTKAIKFLNVCKEDWPRNYFRSSSEATYGNPRVDGRNIYYPYAPPFLTDISSNSTFLTEINDILENNDPDQKYNYILPRIIGNSNKVLNDKLDELRHLSSLEFSEYNNN